MLADAASKRLFIADSTNHRIVITNLEGKKIAIAGTGKKGMNDGKFAEATFSDPQGMALEGDTLYVADRENHSIRALNLKDETVKRVAGTGEQNRFGRKVANRRFALRTTLLRFDKLVRSKLDKIRHRHRHRFHLSLFNRKWQNLYTI